MYAIAFLQGMVFYGPVATLYRQAKGISILQITLIESISLILCLILEFPWGILADKIGYKKTILICNALYFLSKIIFWKAENFSAFLFERIIISIVIAGLSGVDTALLYLSCEEPQTAQDANPPQSQNKSHQVFGIWNSLQTAGLLIASLVFSAAADGDYSLAALFTVISYGLAALLSLALTEVRPSKKEHSFRNFVRFFKQTATDKYILLFLIGIALLNETHQTVTVFLNQLQYVKCGLSSSAIGYIYTAVTVAGLCSAFSSKITGKLGTASTVFFLFTAAAAACLLLAFTASAWLSVLGILILRISFSLFQPLQTELQNRQITGNSRATILSMNAVIIDSVGAGTNIAFGSLAQHNLTHAFLFGAALCIAGGLFLRLWYMQEC